MTSPNTPMCPEYRLRDGDIVDSHGRRITVSGNAGVCQLLNDLDQLKRKSARSARKDERPVAWQRGDGASFISDESKRKYPDRSRDFTVPLYALSETAPRPCTCHPDDNPPRPCPQKFALSECRAAASHTDKPVASMDFQYLLNAMEFAARCDKPFEHAYADKRRAVLDHVARLECARSATVDIPLCGNHAESWFCERNHLNGGMEAKCVVCAFHRPEGGPTWVDLGPRECGNWKEGLHGYDLYRLADNGRWYMLRLNVPPLPSISMNKVEG